MTVTAQRGTHHRWYTPHWAAVLSAVVAGCVWLVVLPRMLVRLNPLTGDEPFYVMTALSLIREHTLDETRAYTLDRLFLSFYPPTPLPADWQGWPSFPNPLPPHAAHSRLPGLHTKHGLGLSLLIALPWALGGRLLTELTLLAIAVLVTANMALLASEAGAPPWLAALLAVALAVVMPIGPYAFLIFPELPAALALPPAGIAHKARAGTLTAHRAAVGARRAAADGADVAGNCGVSNSEHGALGQ